MNIDKGIFLSVIAFLLVLSVLLVLPFLQFFLLAVLLAYVLSPLQDWLAQRTGAAIAAALLVLGATVTVILPLVIVVRRTATEAASLIKQIQSGNVTFDTIEEPIRQVTGVDVDMAATLSAAARDVGTGAFDGLLGVFGLVAHTVLGLGLTVFLLYYFLKDSGRLWAWIHRTVPLPRHVQDDLYDRIDGITGGVLAGHVLVAIIQGVIAGIGLFVVGIPNALFWTVVMVVLALFPAIGSFLVWGPAAVYLFLNGEPLSAAALFVYGTVIVGVSDDYLRPVVVDHYAKINPSVIIIGVLGGVYVLGFMGIFFGPIIIGALRVMLDVFTEEYTPTRYE